MIYLKKDKELLENESYVYGRDENQQMLIPLHEFDELVTICPDCGTITGVDSEIIYEVMKDADARDEDLESVCDINVYCTKCTKKRASKKTKEKYPYLFEDNSRKGVKNE